MNPEDQAKPEGEVEATITHTEKQDVASLESDEMSEGHEGAASKKKTSERKMCQDGKISVLDVPMREFSFAFGATGHICFNPLTSLIGITALWGLAIWCMVDPGGSKDTLSTARSNVSLMFSWLIIAQKPISFFFTLFIAYKFGHIKFGAKDEKPEFDGAQFFSMIL